MSNALRRTLSTVWWDFVGYLLGQRAMYSRRTRILMSDQLRTGLPDRQSRPFDRIWDREGT